MDPIEMHPGERRYVAAELSALIAEDDSLTGTPTVEVVAKRGRTATDMLAEPAPSIDGTSIEFWVEAPDDPAERGIFLGLVTCETAEGETIVEEVEILVI